MNRDVLILSQERFEKNILPKIDEFKNTFFISIVDPEDKDLHERTDSYRVEIIDFSK